VAPAAELVASLFDSGGNELLKFGPDVPRSTSRGLQIAVMGVVSTDTMVMLNKKNHFSRWQETCFAFDAADARTKSGHPFINSTSGTAR